jgi:autotransporter-associated beta strand protein
VGYSTNATGILTVNSGTVLHAGTTAGAGFASVPNSIDVGAQGATGTLIVNGGQVLNNLPLYLGDGSTSIGTLQLNGGLVQASQVTGNASPTTSTANFNGGTLRAATNSTDFIDGSTLANVQTGGLILDDGGWAINLPNSLQTDPSLLGGGLIKQGAGTVYLDAANTYTGTTVVTNGTLAGVGSVSGNMVEAPAGSLGAGDAAGVGTFTIGGNLTLQGNATLRVNKTGGSPAQDNVTIGGNVTYGGILTVTNITSDANSLTTSDTFQLFSVSGSHTGNFSGIAGSPGTGLAYSFNPASGILSIITQTIAPNPTNITFRVSGNTLTLAWPADHIGWILQAQTNSLSTGLSPTAGNWFDIAGSSSSNTNIISINPANPAAFYRLRHP